VDLGIFYHYCSKASSFKTTGYLAYPALIFCAAVEVKFLPFYLSNLLKSCLFEPILLFFLTLVAIRSFLTTIGSGMQRSNMAKSNLFNDG
jgi:hypothetical protein